MTPSPTLDSGDSAWMLTASLRVLMMTLPGLALFYGVGALAQRALGADAMPGDRLPGDRAVGSLRL